MSQPKRAVRPLQGSNAKIEVAEQEFGRKSRRRLSHAKRAIPKCGVATIEYAEQEIMQLFIFFVFWYAMKQNGGLNNMMILFLILLLAAVVCAFVSDVYDIRKLDGVGLVIGLAAGIILAIEITKSPSKSTNPYFLGTFVALMCAGASMGIGFGLGEWMKKKKKK